MIERRVGLLAMFRHETEVVIIADAASKGMFLRKSFQHETEEFAETSGISIPNPDCLSLSYGMSHLASLTTNITNSRILSYWG
jgi:hypothetical protein